MSENITMMAPPLDVDLATVKTDMPLLANGIYDFQISKVEQRMSKANKKMLHLELRTTAPSSAQDGSTLGPSIPVFENLNLEPSGQATWEMVLRNVGAVAQAVGLNVKFGEFQANGVALLTGQVARCKVGFEPAGVDKNGKSFKAKNVIELWVKRA